MPDSLMTCWGSIPISKNASMIRSEIALCPHPAHKVVLPPRYGWISSPIRFVLPATVIPHSSSRRAHYLNRLFRHVEASQREYSVGDGQAEHNLRQYYNNNIL